MFRPVSLMCATLDARASETRCTERKLTEGGNAARGCGCWHRSNAPADEPNGRTKINKLETTLLQPPRPAAFNLRKWRQGSFRPLGSKAAVEKSL